MFPTSDSSYSRVSVQSVKLPCVVASGGSLGEYSLPGAIPTIPNLRPFSSFRLSIGKADGELLHKLLAFSAYPSTLCFFAFMLVAQALLLITDHRAALFFVSLKLASLWVRFVDENAQLLHLFIATAVSFIPLSFRLYTPHPRSCLVLLAN